MDFSVLVPGGVTMGTRLCTSDGNSTWEMSSLKSTNKGVEGEDGRIEGGRGGGGEGEGGIGKVEGGSGGKGIGEVERAGEKEG